MVGSGSGRRVPPGTEVGRRVRDNDPGRERRQPENYAFTLGETTIEEVMVQRAELAKDQYAIDELTTNRLTH